MSLFCFSVLDFQQNLADLTAAVLRTSKTSLQLWAGKRKIVTTARTNESLMKTARPVKHTIFILKE